MSWEELPGRASKSRTVWAVTIKAAGVTIWLPNDHRLAVGKVSVMIGKGEHRGMLRFAPSAAGRAVNKTARKAIFIRFSTLPFAPAQLPMTELHAVENADGSTDLTMPWKLAIRTVEVA